MNATKRTWVKKWIRRRDELGTSNLLLKELAAEDPKEYRLFLRLTPEMFNNLLCRISDTIQRQNTIMRGSLSAKIKLELTLTFLASGCSYRTLSHLFRVPKSTISSTIPEVLDAIYESLNEFIKVPSTTEEWAAIKQGFLNAWNFPNCHGALDGKHVLIQSPPNCGSQFFNYKGFHSIILLAVASWDYTFLYIDVGCNGIVSDGGVLQNSALSEKLEQYTLFGTDGCIIGDDAFPLKPYLMKPFKIHPLTTEKKIFNYRLSRARRVVENAFGILTSRFRIFTRKIECQLSTTDKIVKASCALHNWLIKTSASSYLSRGSLDEENIETGEIIPGQWRSEITELFNIQSISGRNCKSSKLAKLYRNNLARYFSNEGAVPWQNGKV
ncbi:putative nuclease HARBI1 like protein [Argiope bruennichi]|uniref:Putative nuclease HARBI1 like protein n=1 Tax=Argiope bruennichi TaxID=94029 RepID=A0A8T0EQD5_ARGBR|nr:putative nuclease HARBI1 like protein [Argiope bruennichi]